MAVSTLAVRQSAARSSPEFLEDGADTLTGLARIGEQLDPLKVALSGFPDVNSYYAYYEGAGK